MPKLLVTRHHSNGDITVINNAMYPGMKFDMLGGFNLFLELEGNSDAPTLGIEYNAERKQWEVQALGGRTEIFK